MRGVYALALVAAAVCVVSASRYLSAPRTDLVTQRFNYYVPRLARNSQRIILNTRRSAGKSLRNALNALRIARNKQRRTRNAQRTTHNGQRSTRNADGNVQRIFGGTDDSVHKYRYVVALLVMNLRICSGTLITPTWVLTAAHCNRATSVQYGNMTISPKDIETQSKLLKRIPHQSFRMVQKPGQIRSDIAMILVEEVPLKVFGKLAAVDYRAISGHQVEYAGFGDTRKEGGVNGILEEFMRPLQLAVGVVVSCTAMYDLFTPCICVAPRCSVDQSVLPGDSGGPLFHDGKVVGVAHRLLEQPVISLFMPVSPYLTWIHQVITTEEKHLK